MEKVKIDLDILLPELIDEKDACIDRLITSLEGHKEIEKVHLNSIHEQSKTQLCFHYDPNRITLQYVEKLAKNAGAQISSRYGHLLFNISYVRHPRHARLIEKELAHKSGILHVSVAGTGIVSVEYDKQKTNKKNISMELSSMGFEVREMQETRPGNAAHKAANKEQLYTFSDEDIETWEQKGSVYKKATHKSLKSPISKQNHVHGGLFDKNSELIFSLVCGVLLGVGYGLTFIDDLSVWVTLGFFFGAYFFGAYYVVKEAYEAISKGQFEIDFLMLVAAAGAGILGQWEEGALLLFLFSLGHALEHYAMEKARKSIEALADLAPKTALRKDGNNVNEVPIDELAVNDIIVIRPNTKIAADGLVMKGTSGVNQAPITGESIPVDKFAIIDQETDISKINELDAKYRVFSGSINGNGTLEVKVSREAGDSTISRVVKMVNEAQTQKSPTQRFTDRFEKLFVPGVLILVLILCFAFLVIDESFSKSFYRAMAVLVAASPCALAISTPSAVLSGIARAARSGVLVKGGRPLEDLGSLTALAFDKTGTLTEGKPKITKVMPVKGITEEEILQTAVAVEALSDHPLAKAIVRDGKERLGNKEIPTAENLEAILGKGIKAMLGGKIIYIGNLTLFESLDKIMPTENFVQLVQEFEGQGNTTMIVRREDEYIGLIAVMDIPRPEAKEVLLKLKDIGIRRMIMLTGDNQQVADTIAKELNLTEAWGGLLPEEKVQAIKKLRQQENRVAMVGDGVNDAPAMANSTVGIAMGAAGSDVALETADIALMGDKLSLLPFAIGLSRKAKRIIKQNLWISLSVVAVLIPLTMADIASIGPAVLAHEGSTLLVVFNALRLLAYSEKDRSL